MQNETVDVIIPIYNNIDIINNILKKLSELYEYNIIVIDDCSIDGTYELINRFLKKKNIEYVKLLRNNINKGPSYCRNLGLEHSKKEYIAFLDSDDDWHPQKIKIQLEIMRKHNILISGTNHKIINLNEISYYKKIDYNNNPIPFHYIKWPYILYKSPFATPSVIIQKGLKKYLFNEDIRYAEDFNLWIRIVHDNVAVKIDLPLTYTFKHDWLGENKSLSTNLFKMQKGLNKSYFLIYKQYKNNPADKLFILIAILFAQFKFIRRILIKLFKIIIN
jgi:glycosyltransferase involved in cell wall biosynthesis